MKRLALPSALLAVVLMPGIAGAMTIVPIADSRLVDQADVIAEVTFSGTLPPTHDRAQTDWMATVARVLKGEIDSGSIVVSLPGGLTANGRTFHIYGTPPISPGRRAIVFLRRLESGNFALADFPQGVFFGVTSSIRGLAVRDYSEVTVIEGGRVGQRETMRDYDRFADWIEDRAHGRPRIPDYVVQPRASELSTISDNSSFFEEGGLRLRWFNFDNGGSVSWFENTTPVPGLSGGGTAEFKRALLAWTAESTTPVRLVYAGKTAKHGGLVGSADGTNAILWTDLNDEISGTFDCTDGGTIAYGGPWYASSVKGTFDNTTYIRIQQADIVFNDGIECQKNFSPNYSKFIEEVAAHELGHTLGLDHSSERDNEPNATLRDALMYKYAHDDGRGATLKKDDIGGLQTLYRVGGATGGGGGGGGGTPASGCPAGTPANTLCLVKGRFKVTATWENQYNSTNGDALPIPNSDVSGFFYFTDKTNVELIVKILASSSNTQVFYSQLTDLHFVLNVTDTQTGRTKVYRNTAGNCGGLDESFDSVSAASTSGPLEVVSGNSSASCTSDARTLCLLDNRFAVTVDWRNQYDGSSGVGAPKPISRFTGGFSFTGPANLELFIKTLQFPDNLLVLYGALSNLEYTIHVTDTTSGARKDYHNPAGNFCGGLDNHAF